jgi:hypothetical protein
VKNDKAKYIRTIILGGIFAALAVLVVLGIAEYSMRAFRTSEYFKCKMRLDADLKKDARFTAVQVHFAPDAPSAFVMAPSNLDANTRNALTNLIKTDFGTLSIPIYYKDMAIGTNK